jgi:matrixin
MRDQPHAGHLHASSLTSHDRIARAARRQLSRALVAGVLAIAMAAVPRAPADAGHTIQSGDCWRGGTPLLCRTTWTSSTHIVNLNLVDWFSAGQPGWLTNAESACNNWHNYVLASDNDIWCHWDPYGASSVYLSNSTNGNHGLAQGILGITWNCPVTGPCVSTATAMNIWISSLFFNQSSGNMNSLTSTQRTSVFAHEMGHALGLFHHSNTSYLMNPSIVSSPPTGPTSGDYGTLPACSGASSTYGVRCVYDFSR